MGVEYERWLVAKGNVFSPGAASLAKLVERLRKEGFIPDPAAPEFAKLRFEGAPERLAKTTGGFAVKTIDNSFGDDAAAQLEAATEPLPAPLTAAWLDHPTREEIRLVFPVRCDGAAPVRCPLSRAPAAGAASWALEIHSAPEYVYPSAKTIEPLDTVCACGEDLAFEWDTEEVVPAFARATGIFAECEACSRTFDPAKASATIRNPFDDTAEEVRGGAAYRFALKVVCGEAFAPDAKLAFSRELVALVEDEFGRAFYEFGARS